MAWTNLEDFVGAVPLDRYLQLHPWFGGWAEDPLGDVLSAWRLYKQAKVPALGFLLLGETKIRIDPTLVQGFGLMSAAGVQDPEVVRMVAALKVQAWWRGTGTPELKLGSILSDQNWSPLLNDALVLGGIHGRRECFLADHRMRDVKFVQPSGVAGARATQEARSWAAQRRLADLSGQPWEVQVWRQWLQENQSMLWDRTAHVPRVLARELIGLESFGYVAVMRAQQLSFLPAGPGSERADFATYLERLRQAGYFSGNQPALLARLSQFLFGHADALLPV